MSTFVLVHGAWHGGWCWERVAPLLREQGHEVLTPTLTGLAERAGELTREVGIETHVADVLDALSPAPEPVVLVSHSYSGLVVQAAASRAHERVASVVHIDGWVGPGGASLFGLAPDWFAAGVRQLADEGGDGWRIPVPDPVALGISDPGDLAWAAERLTDHPLRTLADAVEFDEGASASIPARAILAPPGPVAFAEMAAARSMPTTTLQGGHDLMITSPDALARALMEDA